MKKSLAIVVVLAMAATANAAVSTYFTDMGTHSAGGADYRVWDMMTEVTTDWTNARLDLILTSGTLYQHPVSEFGSDVEGNPAAIGMYPDVEWDTYVASPIDWTTAPALADDPPYMSDTSITASWFDSIVGVGGTYRIARISLSTDAQGTLTGKVYDVETQGVGVVIDVARFGLVKDGEIIPEPATLMLLAIGGIGALLRKRR